MQDTTASRDTDRFAAFRSSCSAPGACETAWLRCWATLVVACGLTACATLHCKRPSTPRVHGVSKTQCVPIDCLLICTQKLKICLVRPGLNPSAAAVRFNLPRVRCVQLLPPCLHALLQCSCFPLRSALGLAPACCERRLERNHRYNLQAGTLCFRSVRNAAWPVRRDPAAKRDAW